MTVGDAVLVWLLTVTGLGCVALIVLAVAAVKIARLVVEGDVAGRRPIPRRGGIRAVPEPDDEPMIEGVNGHPDAASEPTPSQQLDDTPALVEVMGDVDAQLRRDREAWWAERRAEGLSDDEIAKEEARLTVKVFS